MLFEWNNGNDTADTECDAEICIWLPSDKRPVAVRHNSQPVAESLTTTVDDCSLMK